MLNDRDIHGERGFTLIELLVASVLLMVVIGVILYGLTSLDRGSDSMKVDRRAQQEALDAMEQVRHDLDAAHSPSLENFDGRRETLRDALYHWRDSPSLGSSAQSRALCSSPPAQDEDYLLCLQDVTVATPSELWFRADVNASLPGSECVGYGVSGTSFTRWESTDWRQCGSAAKTAATTRATKLLTAEAMPTSVFSYTLRYNPSVVPLKEADPNDCATSSDSSAQATISSHPRFRNMITSVELDLSGIATRRDAAAVSGLQANMPISGRAAGDYAYAMGCSY